MLAKGGRKLRAGATLGSLDKFLPILYPRTATLFDYIDSGELVFLSEPVRIKARALDPMAGGRGLKGLSGGGVVCSARAGHPRGRLGLRSD